MATGRKSAIIIGASSGIGEALARQLHQEGWQVGLLARRQERLAAIAAELKDRVLTGYADAAGADAVRRFEEMVRELGEVDLVVLSAGTGYLNAQHDTLLDQATIAVNVSGFVALANAAFRHFEQRGRGQLAAITSVGGLRGNGTAASYAASKAFQSIYLDSLRDSARRKKLPIVITELQPGFVATDMMKTEQPLPAWMYRLLVSDAVTAARQMLRVIARRKKHAFITRRYAVIAWLVKLLPRP